MQKLKQLIQRGISPVLAILIIIVVSIIVGIVLLLSLYFWQPAEPQEQPNVLEAEDETAGWQIYRNEEYGFEVKYPKDWSFYRQKGSPIITFCGPEYFGNCEMAGKGDTAAIVLRNDALDITHNSFCEDYSSNVFCDETYLISKTKTKIGNIDGWIFEIDINGRSLHALWKRNAYDSTMYELEADQLNNYPNHREIFDLMISTFKFIDFEINWVRGEDYSEHVGSKTVEFVVGEENPYTKILSWPAIKNIPDEEVLRKINDILDFDKNVEFMQQWTKTHNGITYIDFSVNYDKNNILSITFYIGFYGAYPSESSFGKNIDIRTGNLLEITDFTDKSKAEILNLLNNKFQPIKDKVLQNLLDIPSYQDDKLYDSLKHSIQNSRFREEWGHLDDFKVTDEGIEYDCYLDIPHAFRVIKPENCLVILIWDEL